MQNKSDQAALSWYAARIVGNDPVIIKQLSLDGVRSYSTRCAGSILFIRCTAPYAASLITLFWGRLFFYLNAERSHPAVIPDGQMENFIFVTSLSADLVNLGTLSPDFLQGTRVRVTEGPFKGAVGVVKRIKGDRRLVVSIDGVTAVATCHIKQEFLEKADPD